jgi:hypothetical protein
MQAVKIQNVKIKKVAAVILMTLLIWVWADLALDDSFPLSSATITISNSRDNLWVSFSEKRSIQVENIKLKGPAARISELKQRIYDNKLSRDFFIDAEQQELTTPGNKKLKVVDFLKTGLWVKEMGLTVESCEPEVVDVNVVLLVPKDLVVQCFDESGNLRKPASLEPQKIRMNVPEDWSGDKLIARVDLLNSEIERAQSSSITKKPYVILSQGQHKDAPSTVKIKMPSQGGGLSDYSIATPSLTYAMSRNMFGKYDVEIIDLPELLNKPINIKATADAKQAYESQTNRALMTLHILDSDADKISDEKTHKVIYNFPEEFVRKGEIMLNQEAATVRFRLKPAAPVTTTP